MKTRILYIEDNEANLYLVTYLLGSRGHQVEPAMDGAEGIRRALERVPDLILLDIQLPIMDGYEIARRLRAEPALDRVPLVALTSYAMAGDREKALAAGCDGYLEKPINPDTFIAQIEAFLGV
jgi:CheY-like chemotaxis protein